MPAVPLEEAGRFVAGAYGVFVALLVVYVGIMAVRLGRLFRELEDLTELAERRTRELGGGAGSADAPAGERGAARKPPSDVGGQGSSAAGVSGEARA